MSSTLTKKEETRNSYNQFAQQLADKFNELGPRTADIDRAFQLVGKKNPFVLEIGCGNGRDAKVIGQKTDNYLGMDISAELLAIAKAENPTLRFELGDMENYNLPANLDIVLAFASLIHAPKDQLEKITQDIYEHLNPGGVLHLSMIESPSYTELSKNNEYGIRHFYLYSESELLQMTQQFSVAHTYRHHLRNQDWIELTLQKPFSGHSELVEESQDNPS